MIIALIAAVARNGTIGDHGRLPWHIRDDLKRFKRLTTGHAIIMGRKTFESIGKPLPDRRNLVLTRNTGFQVPAGVEMFHGLDEALGACRERGETMAFVIGGAEVYRQALPVADQLFLTLIDADVPGDTKFPHYDTELWTMADREASPECTFVDYRRKQRRAPENFSTGTFR